MTERCTGEPLLPRASSGYFSFPRSGPAKALFQMTALTPVAGATSDQHSFFAVRFQGTLPRELFFFLDSPQLHLSLFEVPCASSDVRDFESFSPVISTLYRMSRLEFPIHPQLSFLYHANPFAFVGAAPWPLGVCFYLISFPPSLVTSVLPGYPL